MVATLSLMVNTMTGPGGAVGPWRSLGRGEDNHLKSGLLLGSSLAFIRAVNAPCRV